MAWTLFLIIMTALFHDIHLDKELNEEMEEDKTSKNRFNQYSMSFENDEKVYKYKDYNDYVRPLARFAQLENKQLFKLPHPSRAGVRGVGRGGAGKNYVFGIIDWSATKTQTTTYRRACKRHKETPKKSLSKKKYHQLELSGWITQEDKEGD